VVVAARTGWAAGGPLGLVAAIRIVSLAGQPAGRQEGGGSLGRESRAAPNQTWNLVASVTARHSGSPHPPTRRHRAASGAQLQTHAAGLRPAMGPWKVIQPDNRIFASSPAGTIRVASRPGHRFSERAPQMSGPVQQIVVKWAPAGKSGAAVSTLYHSPDSRFNLA